MPERTSRHDQGDPIEDLIFYSRLHGLVSIEECVEILSGKVDDSVEAFANLIGEIEKRLMVTNEREC